MSSKASSSNNISKIIGKGTLFLDATIAKRNSVGINSWWKVVIAIYNPGRVNVINKAISLIPFKKSENWYFKFISSGDVRKSISTAGAMSA